MQPQIESIKVKRRKAKGKSQYLMNVQIVFEEESCQNAQIFRTIQCLQETNAFFNKMSTLMGEGAVS